MSLTDEQPRLFLPKRWDLQPLLTEEQLPNTVQNFFGSAGKREGLRHQLRLKIMRS